MTEEIKYGSDLRNGHFFGRGTDYLTRAEYQALAANSSGEEVITQARQLGWSHGCPVAKELSDPTHSPDGSFWIAARYSNVNHWFREFLDITYHGKPEIYQQLITPIKRLSVEPIGKHEPESVPQSHLEQLSPMSRPVGYALPRVLIEYVGRGLNPEDKGAFRGGSFLIEALEETTSPANLLALTAEKIIVLAHKEPTILLQHILATSVLEEENCRTLILACAQELEKFAPSIWRAYLGLSTTEKRKLEIIDL